MMILQGTTKLVVVSAFTMYRVCMVVQVGSAYSTLLMCASEPSRYVAAVFV